MQQEKVEAIMARISAIPIFDTLGMEIISLEDGFCEARVGRRPEFDGIYESFHGGMLATVADTVACWAILARLGAEARLATTDMHIRFLAPCRSDVTATARVIKFGRTLSPVAVELFDDRKVLVAIAQVNYILFG